MDPIDALYAAAHGFLQNGWLSQATSAFRVVIRHAPSDERGWLGLAACHEEMGDDTTALELYGAGAVVALPTSIRCLIGRARLLRRCGDPHAARECLDAAEALVSAHENEHLGLRIAEERNAA